MQVRRVELLHLRMPLVAPFTTSFGTQETRLALLVRVEATAGDGDGNPVEVEGWGECVAGEHPVYSSEYVAGARHVLVHELLPLLAGADLSPPPTPEPTPEPTSEPTPASSRVPTAADRVAPTLRPIVGHHMAKAALEMAVLDAALRGRGVSLATHLGATRTTVPSGVSVGLQDDVDTLVRIVGDYLDQGYVRIKLKIKPGNDVDLVAAVRAAFGDDLPLQVDANAAYTLDDLDRLRALDDFGLLLVEQPLANDDLWQHAKVARELTTPVCLDESIESVADARAAIEMGATAVVNIKPGRVGGYLEAVAIHDLCRDLDVDAWCGGMLETGLGRGANAALAALEGFTLPGDISASSRFYREDVTEPFVLEDGHVRVPTGPGLGVAPLPKRLADFLVSREDAWPT